MQTLAVVVRGLDRLDVIGPAVGALGERHAGYGVKTEDFETVGCALLDTLAEGLGAAFTPETRAAWTAAYGLLAGVMQTAGAHAAQSAPATRPAVAAA